LNKEFRISIKRPGEKGAATASTLALPATWGELTDALERARIYDERQIYSVTILKAKRDFLEKHIPDYVNLYELNYLAERLEDLKEWENDVLEALVRMDEAKEDVTVIPMERLINITYSVGSCHHVGGISNDRALGEFVLENEFREDLAELSEDSSRLLDREKLGREYREATGGVILKDGYFENSSGEISSIYKSGNLPVPEKPGYIFRLEIAEASRDNKPASDRHLTVKLPTDQIVLETVLKTLRSSEGEGYSCRRFDSILPGLDEIAIDLDDLEQMNELASCIRNIEESGQLPKYKALILSVENPDPQTVLHLAKEIDAFTFFPDMASPADYADHILEERHDIRPGDSWYPYIDRYGYGCSAMEKDNVKQTVYGFICRTDGGPILSNEDQLTPVLRLLP